MTPPTPEELLRLARKAGVAAPAWKPMNDNTTDLQLRGMLGVFLSTVTLQGDAAAADRQRKTAALHAALLVLAGELDVAELLAERDFYRNEVMLYERAASFCPPKEDP